MKKTRTTKAVDRMAFLKKRNGLVEQENPTPEKKKSKTYPDNRVPTHSTYNAAPGAVEKNNVEYTETEAVQKYPSPVNDVKFRRRWASFVHDVTSRDNFKLGHLEQLHVLCDLYLEYDFLMDYVRVHGYSVTQEGGRHGDVNKPTPELVQLNRCRSEIRSYSKLLGLVLVKDADFGKPKEEEDEWA